MTAAFGNAYVYDANGNQITRTVAGTVYAFAYDYENRLASVKQGGTTLATFIYDADGGRVKGTISGTTTIYVAGLYEWQNGATTKYYDGGAMRRTGYASGNGISYILGDQLGSSSMIVGQNGVAQATNYYFPYGGNRGSSAFSALTTKRFTGQYHEQGLPGGEGLSFYNARWYDAQLGRFVSPDTIIPAPSEPQAFNRYSYVYDNPINHTDPTGHDCDDGPQTWAACQTGKGSTSVIRAADTRTGGGRTFSQARHVRIYFLNAIGLGRKRTLISNNDLRDEQGYEMYKLDSALGKGKVTHIPIYYGDGSKILGLDKGGVTWTRFQMFAEMFEHRVWSEHVADTIEQDLKDRPLRVGERVVMVGISGGGTVAIESLDLLKNKGITVDQVVLRGSPVQELGFGNFRRLDYITSGQDYYYSVFVALSPNVEIHEHVVDRGRWTHVPQEPKTVRLVADEIAESIAQ